MFFSAQASNFWVRTHCGGYLLEFLLTHCRDFIENHYVELKQLNPKFPFLIRECSGIEPKLYGRFGEFYE